MSEIKRQRSIQSESITESLTVREWNRLKSAEKITLTDEQVYPSIRLVFTARRAWKHMKDKNFECISVNAIYHGKHVYVFKRKVKRELPW